jgi:hypothetical protein
MQDIHRTPTNAGFCGRLCLNLFSHSETAVSLLNKVKVQSASPSWNKAPIWGLRADLYYCKTVAGLLM